MKKTFTSLTSFQKSFAIISGGVITGTTIYWISQRGKSPNEIPGHSNNESLFKLNKTLFERTISNNALGSKWDYNWDHRSPTSLVEIPKNISDPEVQAKYESKLKDAKAKATRHIILVRHGQYNLEGKDDKEKCLTDMGKKQADYTGQRLKEMKIHWNEMIRSTMTRAQETGAIIAKHISNIDIVDSNFIVEGAPIEPDPPVRHWKPSKTYYEEGSRIECAFRKYFYRARPDQKKDSYTLMVCHANVIRYFICRVLQFPPEGWLRFSLNHASITWISLYPNGRVSVRTVGDSGHIPIEFISSR